MSHLCLHGREVSFHLFEPVAQFVDVEVGNFRYILVPDAEGERFLLESLSMALRTFDGRYKLVSPFLSCSTLVILYHLLQIVDDAIVCAEVIRRGMHLLFTDLYVFQ